MTIRVGSLKEPRNELSRKKKDVYEEIFIKMLASDLIERLRSFSDCFAIAISSGPQRGG